MPPPRGGFGPKHATSVGNARSPVDCITRRVPGRGGGASFFLRSRNDTEKRSFDDKKNRASTRAANRRDACTITREREGWEGGRGPSRLSVRETKRRSARARTSTNVRTTPRFLKQMKETCRLPSRRTTDSSSRPRARSSVRTRACAPSRRSRLARLVLKLRNNRTFAAHASVTLAASMSVTTFLPARTCA